MMMMMLLLRLMLAGAIGFQITPLLHKQAAAFWQLLQTGIV
jgi:hypothetical protein